MNNFPDPPSDEDCSCQRCLNAKRFLKNIKRLSDKEHEWMSGFMTHSFETEDVLASALAKLSELEEPKRLPRRMLRRLGR